MSFFQMSLKALDLNYSACTQKSKILTHLPNPRTSELKKSNHQIRRLHFSEEAATKDKLPVHVILGAANTGGAAGFVTWRFQKSVAMSGWWNIFNKVTLEVSSSSFTIKQGTDIEKVTEYCSKKNRKDVKTWRVSHSYGTTVGRKKFRAGTWGTHREGDSLHPTSSSD